MSINKQSLGFPSIAKDSSMENIDHALDYSKKQSYYSDDFETSIDPFESKDNPYAEANLVKIATCGSPVHFKWGDVNVADATTSDPMINQYTYVLCAVNHAKPYLRLIANGTGCRVSVTEFFTDVQD